MAHDMLIIISSANALARDVIGCDILLQPQSSKTVRKAD